VRKWAKRIVVVLAVLLLVPLALEITIQVIGDPRRAELVAQAKERAAYWQLESAGFLEVDDQALRFKLRPGFDETIGGVEYRVNALGLRGGPISTEKPAGTKRVLIVGDSYAFGLGVREEDSLEMRLQELLERTDPAAPAAPPAKVEVLNLGVPAYQTQQELTLLERVGFPLSPDLVVLVYYANDNVVASLTFAPGLGMLYVDELPVPYSWKATLSRSYLYSLLARADAKRRFDRGEYDARGDRCWPVTSQRLRDFAAACSAHHVPFLLAALPELSGRKELRDDDSPAATDQARVIAFATAQGWPVVDLRTGLLERVRAIESLFVSLKPIDNHLNAEGNRVVAELLAPEIQRLLVR